MAQLAKLMKVARVRHIASSGGKRRRRHQLKVEHRHSKTVNIVIAEQNQFQIVTARGAVGSSFTGHVRVLSYNAPNASKSVREPKSLRGPAAKPYWIAHRACKYIFDDIDGLCQAPEPISYAYPALRIFFNISDRKDMLPYLYTNFDKSKFASFAMEVVNGCEKKDPLCLHILRENGVLLAKHIVALARKAGNDIKLHEGGLNVVCVGSVWKSWGFMKDAFLEEIHDSHAIDELTLLRLTASSAIGAGYLAAEKIDWIFTKPYEKNINVLYHYKRENYVKPTIKIESEVQLVSCK
ncbi:N-acetyl-D-glucosamine kinase-like [Hylaeus anthracinus]|uniref:N-acetyl-D-glucosamine kinase-like n=1 Tax=Hylaeus anthracinus TaxID=313031 RepID=UPI0023B8D611|nr:N-acetyl-D-glucosamine kinase-like [Hylaeus anthracinus]